MDCNYCLGKDYIEKFGRVIFETEVSLVIVFKDQTHKGRMILAYKEHVAEIKDLDDDKYMLFMQDLKRLAKAIDKVFKPDRINYGAYGDTVGHLHFHLVPKYKDEFEWGTTFQMNTNNYASDSEIDNIGRLIKENF